MNPHLALAALLAVVLSFIGGCVYGAHQERTACKAKAGSAAAKAEGIEDQRDAAIDGIGAATAAGRDLAESETRSSTHASVERIRTVVVPGDCRHVDPGVLRELEDGRQRVNAKIRSGLRQRAAGGDPASAGD